MSFSRKITGYFLVVALLMPTVALPNPALRKGLHVLCAATGGLAAIAPPVYSAKKSVDSLNAPASLPDVPENIKRFCYETLKETGVQEPHKIQIKEQPRESDSPALAQTGYILMRPDTYPGCQANHILLKGIVQHEYAHLKNRDSERGIAFAGAFSVLFTVDYLRNLKTGLSKSAGPSILKSLSRIPSGITKLIVFCGAKTIFIRYIEQQADEGVANDIPTLEAQAKFYRLHNEQILKNAPDHLRGYVEQYPSVCRFSIDPFHPFPLDRAKRFEERIAKLEKEQEQNR